jgi:hypothetical protein
MAARESIAMQDVRWRACHLQRRLRPGLDILDIQDILDRKSVHGSRAALQRESGRIFDLVDPIR